jgi:hypothetical protein
MNSRAIARSCPQMCPLGTTCRDDGECHCNNPPC